MTVIGVTGHTNITNATTRLVRAEIVDILESKPGDITGLTCLARGADQSFADAVIDVGGSLIVVVPAHDYFDAITDSAAQERCRQYLATATSKVTMDHETSGPNAYFDASRYLIDHCDLLLAVWDGSAPSGSGGTADAVDYAREHGRMVTVVWPAGAERQ